jgi:predicted nucleic acid-binding protein
MSDLADALFSYLETDVRTKFYVPDFFYAECASVFVKYVQILKHPAETARQDMESLKALTFDAIPTIELIADAVDIATTHGISGYDACYVALSKQISGPLITADEKLVRAMANSPYDVQSLATFKP